MLDGSTREGRLRCLGYLDGLLSGAATLFSDSRAPWWTRLIMREQQDPGEAFDIFYSGIYRDMLESFTLLVAKLSNRPAAGAGTRIQALTLVGQLVIFMVGRATATRHMGWTTVGEAEIQAVYREVRAGLYARFGEEAPQ
jgi:hypothetical protein